MIPPSLVLITDSRRLEPESFFARTGDALRGGVDLVVVREKQMDSARLLAFASRLRSMTREHGARMLVHTQADVAMAVGADGVHVAAADIPQLPMMRRWLGDAPMILSASCHSADELAAASEAGADFALLSPVFPTASHPQAPHLGVEQFRHLVAGAQLPVVALGGITVENREQLAGYGVAVIGALLDATDAGAAAAALRQGGPGEA